MDMAATVKEKRGTKKKAKAAPATDAPAPATEYILGLRTCGPNGESHNGFRWPESGVVECQDWSPAKKCGNGLHFLPWGQGDWSLLSNLPDAKWQVVRVNAADAVDIDGAKSKCSKCEVIYSGNMGKAMALVMCDRDALQRIMKAGDGATASDKTNSRLAASGDSSSLAASGDSSSLAASGDSSSLAASGYSSRLAAWGDCSRLAASGDYSSLAASGSKSIAASTGYNSRAKAGADGCIALAWWDEPAKRPRMAVGYVGEGIDADKWYVVKDGKMVEEA